MKINISYHYNQFDKTYEAFLTCEPTYREESEVSFEDAKFHLILRLKSPPKFPHKLPETVEI